MRTLPTKTSPVLSLKKDKRSGAMLVLAGLCCLILIPMIGLAVDGANVYLMRNQISTALNAAALAGLRSVSLGTDISSQSASANNVAQMTFLADVSGMNPNISFNPTVPTFTLRQDSVTGVISVSSSQVSANLPLMLLGMLGTKISATTVNLSATAQRRSVNIMLVLDNSGPMGPVGSPALLALQADAVAFVNMFVNGADNIGLVTFSGAPWLAEPLPNLNFQSNVPTDIGAMAAPGGMTNTAAALSTAYGQIQSLNQPGALNVIVVFTAGLAGAFTGNFTPTTTTPCNTPSGTVTGMLWSNQSENQFGGLSDPTSTGENDTPEIRGAPPYCTRYTLTPFRFLNTMPTTDTYGNSTNGMGTISSYAPVSLTSIDAPDITAAAENALDDEANKIRGNATLPATIFVIGLGGNLSGYPPDNTLMGRVANDPTWPGDNYNSSQPAGAYIYAPTTAQLQTAFISIASQVLKLLQ